MKKLRRDSNSGRQSRRLTPSTAPDFEVSYLWNLDLISLQMDFLILGEPKIRTMGRTQSNMTVILIMLKYMHQRPVPRLMLSAFWIARSLESADGKIKTMMSATTANDPVDPMIIVFVFSAKQNWSCGRSAEDDAFLGSMPKNFIAITDTLLITDRCML